MILKQLLNKFVGQNSIRLITKDSNKITYVSLLKDEELYSNVVHFCFDSNNLTVFITDEFKPREDLFPIEDITSIVLSYADDKDEHHIVHCDISDKDKVEKIINECIKCWNTSSNPFNEFEVASLIYFIENELNNNKITYSIQDFISDPIEDKSYIVLDE